MAAAEELLCRAHSLWKKYQNFIWSGVFRYPFYTEQINGNIIKDKKTNKIPGELDE